jgi:hypothetical protein
VRTSEEERTCYPVTDLEPVCLERSGQLANLLSQLTIRVGRDMPRFVAFRYCDTVIRPPEQVLGIVQASAWEPSRHLFDVPILQDLVDAVHGVRSEEEGGPTLLGEADDMIPKNSQRSSQKLYFVTEYSCRSE